MRPRVICHMAASLDGRIVVDAWPASAAGAVRREYEAIHASYDAEGWMCGRITMEPFAGSVRPEKEVARQQGRGSRDDFRAPGDFDSFAFAIDAHGRLAWESNDIGGDHVVAILSERVSDDYLAFLRQRAVSYIIAGAKDIDLTAAVEKIGAQFGVRTLMLEGGGGINGTMMQAGLVDEISVLIAAAVDGRPGTPSVFDFADQGRGGVELRLSGVERRADGVLWLKYAVPSAVERG
ncbi:MAG TPA: dihydrofolate reductase family protein [Gemmatimonadaceae bacterium]|jgi:riboflavin biosynthesis pyrimidine reductase|nr:dihydrofolate reductase family protein [Gemmatimonadaceae bacterium]